MFYTLIANVCEGGGGKPAITKEYAKLNFHYLGSFAKFKCNLKYAPNFERRKTINVNNLANAYPFPYQTVGTNICGGTNNSTAPTCETDNKMIIIIEASFLRYR